MIRFLTVFKMLVVFD